VQPAKTAAALVGLSLPVFLREAVRERDRRAFWTLTGALQLKLLGALPRYHVAYRTYGGVADAEAYHDTGSRIAQGRLEGTMNPRFSEFVGTNFIRHLTGQVYKMTGPSKLGGFLVFSWLAFWGLFLFHRAFAIAVPGGRSRDYSRLVLLWPSLLFWPSSIGKDAWMVLSLGTGSYGAARGLAERPLPVRGLDAVGMLSAARVRPHVAGLFGAALAPAYLVRGRRARALGIGALAVAHVLQANRYLRTSGIETGEGGRVVLEETARRTSKRGGSKFTPPIVRSPAQVPLVPLTVLFRPHPLEAHNPQSLATAAEGALLFALTLTRARWSLAALRSVRRQPYIALCLVYSALYCAAYSGIANFGVLARQRVQLLPFYLVLLSVPPERKHRPAFRFRHP
jgi:hypothetical protein